MTVVVENDGRKAVIDSVDAGSSRVHRVSFFKDAKLVGSQDFHGGGTSDGDLDALQEAQNVADAWAERGERDG